MTQKYFDGVIPPAVDVQPADKAIADVALAAVAQADDAINRLAIHEAIASVWTLVDALNGYITEQAPWVLAKDPANADRLATVLNTCAEGLRVLSVALSPIIPKATTILWSALGAEASMGALDDQPIREAGKWNQLPAGTSVSALEPLFPRIEQEATTD
jgi:methionyl-tRNA synthetase